MIIDDKTAIETDEITVTTCNAVTLSKKQAEEMARMLFVDISRYIKEHEAEYQSWLMHENATTSIPK